MSAYSYMSSYVCKMLDMDHMSDRHMSAQILIYEQTYDHTTNSYTSPYVCFISKTHICVLIYECSYYSYMCTHICDTYMIHNMIDTYMSTHIWVLKMFLLLLIWVQYMIPTYEPNIWVLSMITHIWVQYMCLINTQHTPGERVCLCPGLHGDL